MDIKSRITTLAICAGITFVTVLVVYVAVSNGSPAPRVAFAMFVSVFPALLAGLILSLFRWPVSQASMALLYVVLLILTVVTQGLVRAM